MRRAPIVLSTTAAGLAAVLGFDAHQPALPTASASRAATAPPAPSASATPTVTGGGSQPSTPTHTPTPGPTRTRTATGDAIDTRYGAAQVRVTVSGGKITQVEALQLQGNDRKSIEISSFAEPLLRQSALDKQTAAIDVVSGATFTSASYEASLQSALDRLGFKAADGSRGSATIPSGGG
jgi:uncharacterized protein with FMN-binding domain